MRVWDVVTGLETAKHQPHSASIMTMAFSRDGTTLAWGSFDGIIKVLDAHTWHEWASEKFGFTVLHLAFAPAGRSLAVVGDRRDPIINWNLDTGKKHILDKGDIYQILDVSFLRDGSMLAGVGRHGALITWDLVTGEERRITLRSQVGERVPAIDVACFAPDRSSVAAACLDGTLRLLDIKSGEETTLVSKLSEQVRSMAFSPDGKLLAVGSGTLIKDPGNLLLLDVQTRQPLVSLMTHAVYTRMTFSRDGRLLATGGNPRDWVIRLWDVPNMVQQGEKKETP